MPFDPFILLAIVVFLLMISILVAAHELGHYLVAKWCGMEVEEFAIGFGRKPLLAIRPRARRPVAEFDPPEPKPGIPPRGPGDSETVYTVRPIPLGGFVRVKGMVPAEDGSETRVAGGFYSKPAWQRFLVLAAGPLFSLIFGVIVLAGVYAVYGVNKPLNEPVLGSMRKDGPAHSAGLQPGDRVLTVDGQPVATFFELVAYVRERADVPIVFEYEREGVRATTVVTPELSDIELNVLGPDLMPTGERRQQPIIGVAFLSHQEQLTFGQAVSEALYRPIQVAAHLGQLIRRPAELRENVGGPVTIAAVTNQAARHSLETVLLVSAMLSLSLGFINLLPIPPFDGGQMVIALVEMLRRNRRLSFRVQSVLHGVGSVFVLLLIVSVFWIDIERFFISRPGEAAVEMVHADD